MHNFPQCICPRNFLKLLCETGAPYLHSGGWGGRSRGNALPGRVSRRRNFAVGNCKAKKKNPSSLSWLHLPRGQAQARGHLVPSRTIACAKNPLFSRVTIRKQERKEAERGTLYFLDLISFDKITMKTAHSHLSFWVVLWELPRSRLAGALLINLLDVVVIPQFLNT